MMFAVYITHPQVAIDPAIPVPRWGLSETGRQRAKVAAGADWAAGLGRILASEETKALETAGILAEAAGIPVEILEGSGENDRSATGFLASDAFEAAADCFFAEPDVSFRGWETARAAQARIVAAVERTLATHDPAVPIAFVGHGGVGTLLLCHLSGNPISRAHDQGPGGGGNLFAFSLADRRPVCKWTRIEDWRGWTDG
jgi:broad specificity phosphatase PhoE